MNLISVYERPDRHDILYRLLLERDDTVNISHHQMPEYVDHFAFVESRPYEAWYFIEADGDIVGACYLSNQNEIGIFILRAYQGQRFGPEAVQILMNKHGKRRYLANYNPKNDRSLRMFDRMGFKVISQTSEYAG